MRYITISKGWNMNDILSSNKREKVFLDTAFLASFSIPNHRDSKKARKLLTELTLKYDLHTSPLCFYELWQVVKKYKDFYKGNYRFIRKLNRVLKFIYLKILFREINFSYKQVVSDLKNSTNQITNSGFIAIIPLGNESIDSALDAIDKFDMKPGDAFHFSSINSRGIKSVVTGNKRDFERMGLNIIWF